MWERRKYFPTGKEAYIKVLSKQGRDPLLITSYRPLSLINLDVKILKKILADRLAKILPEKIHPAQVRFTKGRSAILNIRKAMAVLEHTKRH